MKTYQQLWVVLSPQRDSGKFGADSTESAAEDYFGLLAVGGVFLVRAKRGRVTLDQHYTD